MRLFIVALILRLIPVLVAIDLPIGLDDMFQYDMLARSIEQGNGFRWYAQEDLEFFRNYIDLEILEGDYDPRGVITSYRAPGYPIFLAITYAISGLKWRFLAARILQAILGASLAPMTYALSQRIFPESKSGAKLAGWTMALYPMLVIYPLGLASENLFIPLVVAGLVILMQAGDEDQRRDYLLAGALFGAATLTRSVIFGFVLLASAWILFGKLSSIKEINFSRIMDANSWRNALLFFVSASIFVIPWVVRNSLLYDKFTFVENSLGYNLHMGYHPEGSGTFKYELSRELLFPFLDDRLRNELGVQAGLEFIREDPARVPTLMMRKMGHFFGLERRVLSYFYSNGFFGYIPQAQLIALFLVFALPFAIMASLAAAGITGMRWTHNRFLLLLFLLGYLLPHILLMAEPRYHIAVVPALAVLGTFTWSTRKKIWAGLKVNRWQLLITIFLIGLLWLNWGLELWRDAAQLEILFGPDGYKAGFAY